MVQYWRTRNRKFESFAASPENFGNFSILTDDGSPAEGAEAVAVAAAAVANVFTYICRVLANN